MALADVKIKNGKLPEAPGVYLFRDKDRKVLYVGKAANLLRRVSSYFQKAHLRQGFGGQAHDRRIEALVKRIRRIDYEETGTVIEALMREAVLIKELRPPYNIREKDDKSFWYAVITEEAFPRVLLVRGRGRAAVGEKRRFGPFTSASSIREALRILRRVFPWNEHELSGAERDGLGRGCFNYQLGLCPGTCIGAVSQAEYRKTIANLTLFLEGKRERLVRELEQGMQTASRRESFEEAERLRRQLFALQHIQDVALVSEDPIARSVERSAKNVRIEGYDISNISGTSAVGSMVAFVNGRSVPSEYRKFRIKTVRGSNDTAMLREVITRRLSNDWPLPDLMLIDGGVPQVNAVRRALRTRRLAIPVVGIAKGPERKRNDIIGAVPDGIELRTLVQVRDEAHRFAVRYHRTVRARRALGEDPS